MSADVRSRVGSFYFYFPKKWTADFEKQENKLVWPKGIKANFFLKWLVLNLT